MNLAAKLARLPAARADAAPIVTTGVATALRSESAWRAPVARPTAPGERSARAGRRFLASHVHGRFPLKWILQSSAWALRALAPRERAGELDPARLLFLDTETTGLMGGTGTIPFLVGLLWFEGGQWTAEQLFVPRLGAERSTLEALAERVQRASAIVTYNGKSFDWPLLRTRFVLNRLTPPIPAAHVDLVHGARRIWRRHLSSVRLSELERRVLGHDRGEDVDGSEIPERYFRFLRTGNAALLEQVFEHNLHDLLTLATLLGYVCNRLEHTAPDHPLERLGLAELAARVSASHALGLARSVVEAGGAVAQHAALVAAQQARRLGDVESERALLHELLEVADGDTAALLHLRLAKLYEHRRRDLARALVHAGQCGEAEGVQARRKRADRLTQKLCGAPN